MGPENIDIFLGEFLGTMFLILLGNGVVANVLYKRTKGGGDNFLSICVGWGFAVFVGIIIANSFHTGGHLNPAVTTMLWVKGDLDVDKAMIYYASELFGAAIGQTLVVIFYWQHAKEEANRNFILATHSTGPTHSKSTWTNLFCEVVATGVLVSVALIAAISFPVIGINNNAIVFSWADIFAPFTMGLVVLAIGISLGGPTGYAINPARDLIPRIVYQLTPYPGKPSADWKYAWIPVVGPLLAGIIVGEFGLLL